MLGHHILGTVGRGNFLGYGPKGKLTIGGAVLVMQTASSICRIDIIIGKDCTIGMRVTFITSCHEIGDKNRRGGNSKTGKIIVSDGCWIGANVSILPGVTIGDDVVIGTGAVVNKDCEPNCVYVGVPAKIIKRLEC